MSLQTAVDPRESRATLLGRQIHAAEQSVSWALSGYLVAVAFTTAALYRDCGPILVGWLVSSTLFCVPRVIYAFNNARNPADSLPPRAVHKFVFLSVLASLSMAALPLWAISRGNDASFTYLLSFVIAVFVFGCFVHAPVFSSAVAYMATQFLIAVLCFVSADQGRNNIALIIEFLCMTGTAYVVVRKYANLFERSSMQQIELENHSSHVQKQADVIGLLLKDFEEQTSDWLWETDGRGRLRAPSARFVQLARGGEQAVEGASLSDLLSDSGVDGNHEALADLSSNISAHRPFRDLVVPIKVEGKALWWSFSGRPTFDDEGNLVVYRGVVSDITVTRLAQARVEHLAHHDSLTGLPNRASFTQTLNRAFRRSDASDLAVISLDLDGFKPVNDRYGHPVGDALLIAVADRLRDCAVNDDWVARIGGDEFVMLGATSPENGAIDVLCRRIIDRLTKPFIALGEQVTIGTSIGVAFLGVDGETPGDLLKNADAALYRAKAEGRGTFRFFAPEMDRKLQERQQLMHDLRLALARDELVLHFQPYVSAGDGAVTGCEALIRWRHPVRGLVSPATFIPLAEENGLIMAIGAWVLDQACQEAARWPAHQRVSINISPVQFRDRSLPNLILTALTRSGLSPARLEVELTETVLIDDGDAALDILRQIRALGVRVALDDFGTGYSSLSYLRSFPFDKVKIDRSFVQDLTSRRDNQIIVQAIRDLAKGLGMTITAEGVETEAQADQLRLTGCEELQGYLFSRPVAAEKLNWSERHVA